MPAMPAQTAEITMTAAITSLTLTPAYSAASRLPPTMYT